MKKLFYSIVAVAAAMMAFSCVKNITEETVKLQEEVMPVTYTCIFPGADPESKVSLASDGKTGWEVGDQIFVHGQQGANGVTVTLGVDAGSSVSADGQTATFTASISDPCTYSSTIFVAYPASAVKDNWDTKPYLYWSNRFNNTNAHLITGYNDTQNGGTTIRFINLCACISFIVDGDYDGYIFKGNLGETVGYSTYTVRFNNNKSDKKRYYAYVSAEGWCDNTAAAQTSITVPSGWTGADGSTVNKIYIPYDDSGSVEFPGGFTIQFLKSGEIVKQVSTDSSIDLSADTSSDKYTAKYLPLGDVTSYVKTYTPPSKHDSSIDMSGAIDLSSTASSNCYLLDSNVSVAADQVYTFKAYRGNSSVGVGAVASTSIVWETYNNDSAVTANSVIAEVDYDKQASDDFYTIVFKMPGTLHAGNAVIAAKNAGGDILWSWHIWVPSTDVADVDGSNILGATVQDRNLGALVVAPEDAVAPVESFGLFYQWGRKDPFPGPKRVDSDNPALVAGTAATMMDSSIDVWYDGCKVYGNMTIAQTIASPTVFGNVTSGDWDSTKSSTRWSSSDKTIYDPCPVGYKVMDRNTAKPLWSKDNSYEINTNITAAGMTFDVNTTYYRVKIVDGSNVLTIPLAGYIDDGSVTSKPYFQKVNKRAAVYCTYYGPYHLNLRADTGSYKNGSTSAARGCSVRCVAE